MNIDSETDIQITLPADILKKILKTKPQTISIKTEDDLKVRIDYDNKTVICQGESMDEYPLIDVPKGKSKKHIGTWSRDFIRKLSDLVPFCSDDELRAQLNGVYIEQNGRLECCATSGHMLRWLPCVEQGEEKKNTRINTKTKKTKGRNRKKGAFNYTAIIPKKAISILSRCVKDNISVFKKDDVILFELEKGLHFVVNLIDGNFPRFKNVIPHDHKGELTIHRKDLMKLIPEAKGYARRFNHLGVFKIENDKLSIEVSDAEKDIHWQTDMDIRDKSGPDMTIGFNLALLEKMLKTMDADDIIWRYTDPHSAVLVVEPDNEKEDVINLMMPIRLSDNQTDEESHENKPDH